MLSKYYFLIWQEKDVREIKDDESDEEDTEGVEAETGGMLHGGVRRLFSPSPQT